MWSSANPYSSRVNYSMTMSSQICKSPLMEAPQPLWATEWTGNDPIPDVSTDHFDTFHLYGKLLKYNLKKSTWYSVIGWFWWDWYKIMWTKADPYLTQLHNSGKKTVKETVGCYMGLTHCGPMGTLPVQDSSSHYSSQCCANLVEGGPRVSEPVTTINPEKQWRFFIL